MTGILNLVSTGLIFAENFETYPNGWAFDAGGSSAVGSLASGSPAHSGSGAFIVNTKNPFGAGAYARFTKTVNVGSGANRVACVFRGPPMPMCMYDDFLDATLDATRWIAEGPYAGGISNGILSITAGGLSTLPRDTEPNGGLPKQAGIILARCQYVSGSPFFQVWGSWNAGDDVIRLDMNKVDANEYTAYVDHTNRVVHDLAAIDSAWHNWKIDFAKAAVKFYEDDSLLYTDSDSTTSPVDVTALVRAVSFANVIKIDWVGFVLAGLINASFKIGSSTIFDVDICTESVLINGNMYDHGWLAIPSGTTGSQTVELKIRNVSGAPLVLGNVQHIWDDLVVMLDTVVTIESLLGGQKVELYNAGGGLMATATCPGTGSDTTIAVSNWIKTAYGFSGYFKIYDTDGTSLLYTTPTLTIWGGDLYQWIPNQSAVAISTNNTQLYRTGSGLAPTTVTITATLTDSDTGAPLSGKTITFASNLGTCLPTSGTTDANGSVSTTYTAGSTGGLGGVRADFAGDSTYAASAVLQLLDIFYAQPVVDASKDFDAWLEGQQLVISGGNYRLAADFIPQAFTLTTPLLNVNLGGWWYIEIYRRGVKEFSGRILKRSRIGGPNPQLTISGLDEKIMLQRRVANRVYLDEPKTIIDDLLARYPCGITAGAISTHGATISLPATYANLFDALRQIANITGWKFRLNADRTLDFASSFGAVQAITIQTGGNEATAQHDEDWTKIDTKVYVVGGPAAASMIGVASDVLAQLTYGLIEEAFLEKNLTDQGTVNLRAQQLLSAKSGVLETITVDWIDTNPTGTFGPFDIVAVVDADLDLSGGYAIATLQRDLADANKAALGLTNRVLSIADALQEIRKNVQDLGVL